MGISLVLVLVLIKTGTEEVVALDEKLQHLQSFYSLPEGGGH